MILSLSYILHEYSKEYNPNCRRDNGKIENNPEVVAKFVEEHKGYKRPCESTYRIDGTMKPEDASPVLSFTALRDKGVAADVLIPFPNRSRNLPPSTMDQ